ncbi:TraR/DksA family transcriptional regulator [Allopontixanthobacter sp.]|uniref:TraR/DksA family transcriptional regulator n=1 Tax=Allopontixanthobacter sp. TaxID=2906452 RepID=UPI002AB9D5AB|nr:TraR/DksA C4-type zinc finger protein [Allopontixanthobacter sp.]MDZ4307545.1 TraR/DksA C4-type zinc finger protein [Allopontixanthobacter sp.]
MDAGSRAVEMAEQFELENRDRRIALLRSRLAESGVTNCEDCGDDIGVSRIAALPSARRCIGCQTKFERNMRGTR